MAFCVTESHDICHTNSTRLLAYGQCRTLSLLSSETIGSTTFSIRKTTQATIDRLVQYGTIGLVSLAMRSGVPNDLRDAGKSFACFLPLGNAIKIIQ